MNKQEIQNKIDELENKIYELDKQLTELEEELNKSVSKVCKPKYGDRYYCIDIDSEIKARTWYDTDFDRNLYDIGNCFKTREEAEFAVEKLKVIAELKRFAEEHNEPIDWNNDKQLKFSIIFNGSGKYIDCSAIRVSRRNDIYFSSEEIAEQAVAKIGKDRLKKYYFGLPFTN